MHNGEQSGKTFSLTISSGNNKKHSFHLRGTKHEELQAIVVLMTHTTTIIAIYPVAEHSPALLHHGFPFAVALLFHFVERDKAQRRAVDAVAQAALVCGAVGEYVA